MDPSRPSDVVSVAEAVLDRAVEFCAQKLNHITPEAVIDLLRQGDHSTYRYWLYGVAKYVSEHLGAWDESITAIYIYEYDATPEDLSLAEAAPDPLIHLIIWAQRKTAALNSLIEGLDRALIQAHSELLGTHQLKYLLDVQVVDDQEMNNRRGYGALFSSLHHRPLPLWKR
jgi:hypothetical protein